MKTLSSLLLIGFAVVLLAPRMAPAASAAEDKATYCGSGFTQYLVPDDVAGCSLSEACRLHDICYGRCDKDGDLYGSAYCAQSEKSEARNMSKQQCDARLQADIAAQNGNSRLCRAVGGVYRVFVKHLGQGPFNGREALDIYLKVMQSAPSAADADARLEAIHQLQKQGLTDAKEIRYDAERIVIPLNRPVESPLTNGSGHFSSCRATSTGNGCASWTSGSSANEPQNSAICRSTKVAKSSPTNGRMASATGCNCLPT